MNPKIKFRVNPRKDILTFFDFLRDAKYDEGRNFEWAVSKPYPFFKKYNEKINKNVVNDFVVKYYSENQDEIKKNISIYEKDWRKIKNDFFVLVNDLFKEVKWPKGKYIAYTTMWSMYPRFLEDMTFQIPMRSRKKKVVSFIIAHEMLHFIFYEYYLNKYKKYRSHKYDFFNWHVSEIFNVIVMNRPDWQKLLNNIDDGYPEHRAIIKKLSKKSYSLDDLVANITLEVKKSL